MLVNWKVLATIIAASAIGFVLQSPGPIGGMIWPMAEGTPDPEGATLGLLMAMGAIEAIAFGLGVAFLAFGYRWVRGRPGMTRGAALATFLSVAWLLVNWVPHTSLHMAHGNIEEPADFAGLVAIEYGFHLTLILAGCVIAWTTLQAWRSTGQPRSA